MPKLNFNQIKHYWSVIKYEVKWRWEDIKHEHTAGIPDDPNEPKPVKVKIPISIRLRCLKNAIIQTGIDMKNSTIETMQLVGLKSKKEPELPQNDEQAVQTNDQILHPNNLSSSQNNIRGPMSPSEDWHSIQEKFQHFVRTRFTLVQSSIRQFLIGYNEGMGRDLETFKKKQNMSDLLGASEMINKEDWMNKIKTMAGGLRKFREEMHGIAVIKEDDTLLKEDLEKAKMIQQKDSHLNLFPGSFDISNVREQVKSKANDLDTSSATTNTNESTTDVNRIIAPKQNTSS
ncbi:hypothetical protein C9374_007099 [Naegleria lovaniensis]|uniref:Uncharacterized protein n=1 Tax=Naegleria lovaniensis TaxID=51637 RepID=A0AA88H2X9_NAELO|nr:uncharacterized protein C9374_007099 [Naegleria lovaniensis]KAG2393568.1 hypothetical protein C9374_007099 [Naegleria lovaniensis]